MLAQSLFALAVPAAPQAGDASAAPADGEFGRLVDVATRAADVAEIALARGGGEPTNAAIGGAGPQILPGVGTPSAQAKTTNPPRPEILPIDVGPQASQDKTLRPEVLPAEPDQTTGGPGEAESKPPSEPLDPRPEVLPVDVGPKALPQSPSQPPREILPGEVGPMFEALPKTVPAEAAPSAPSAATSPEPGPVGQPLYRAPAQDDRASTAPSGGETAEPASPVGDAGVFAETTSPQTASAKREAASTLIPPPVTSPAVESGRAEPAPAVGAEPATTAGQDGAAAAPDLPAFGLSRVAHETLAQLTAQVVKRLEGKVTRFEMALTPEDLGRVDVSLEMGEDGSLTARLAFDTPAAAAEMRAQVDQLRRQLEQAGFQLARDALEFSHRDGSSPQQDRFGRRQNRAFAAARDLADRVEAAPLMNLSLSLGSARDRVDVKV